MAKKLTPFSVEDILAWEPKRNRGPGQEQIVLNKHFTKAQNEKLNESFRVRKYLTKYERAILARDVGTDVYRIVVWYQNQRKKWRKNEGVPVEMCRQLRREANERAEYQPKSVYMLGTHQAKWSELDQKLVMKNKDNAPNKWNQEWK